MSDRGLLGNTGITSEECLIEVHWGTLGYLAEERLIEVHWGTQMTH
jgi:hypothetical protein